MTLPVCALVAVLAVSADVDHKAHAKGVLDALNKGDFAAAVKDFDKTMKEKLPVEKLAEDWKSLPKQVGEFKKVTDTEVIKIKDATVIDQTCEFGKMTLVLRLSYNKDGQVQGLFLRPPTPKTFAPPPYAKAASYREESVTVGAGGEWPLPGTLTLPREKGPFPVVILVHGSGSHDRDETILASKPFRDLAWGLATKGIAVLRYEKRNHAHRDKMVKLVDAVTIQDEVIDDVLAAAKLLRTHKDVDAKRIVVVGHSLGALVAPRVGTQDPDLAGLVLLAGNSRPLEDLVLEQITYIDSLQGEADDKRKAALADLKKQVERVKAATLTKDTPAKELPLGAPAAYWLALKGYDQRATAAKVKMPMLVLQGERDYQVTMEDFAGWKEALKGRKDATFKSYPTLNHLFHDGKGKAKPEEYSRAGHVSPEVIDDIAAWVKAR